jgi:hypothetical protein
MPLASDPTPRSERGAREEERQRKGKGEEEEGERAQSMLGGRSYRMSLLLTRSV